MFGLKLLGGDYKTIMLKYGWSGKVKALMCTGANERGIRTVERNQITFCSLVSESNKASIMGKVGWGAVGAVALGPLGLLAGVLGGGNKKEMIIALEFSDGTKALVTGSKKEMEDLLKFSY